VSGSIGIDVVTTDLVGSFGLQWHGANDYELVSERHVGSEILWWDPPSHWRTEVAWMVESTDPKLMKKASCLSDRIASIGSIGYGW
jgi:hypothetical protein